MQDCRKEKRTWRILLNKVSEEEILRLLKEKEQRETAQSGEKEAYSHEENEIII